jgi:hypothetical protein
MSLTTNEQQLSTTRLSLTESCGGVCPSYFGSRRQHQVPADWPSPILRFMAPARPSPKPSSHHPLPFRRNPPLTAA